MAQRIKRRRRRDAPTRKRGVMMGMRRGFQKAANTVVTSNDKKPAGGRPWLGTAFSILLVVAALAFLFYRWRG